jgi:hypothetical protein
LNDKDALTTMRLSFMHMYAGPGSPVCESECFKQRSCRKGSKSRRLGRFLFTVAKPPPRGVSPPGSCPAGEYHPRGLVRQGSITPGGLVRQGSITPGVLSGRGVSPPGSCPAGEYHPRGLVRQPYRAWLLTAPPRHTSVGHTYGHMHCAATADFVMYLILVSKA